MNEENDWIYVLKILIKTAYIVTEGFLVLAMTILGFWGVMWIIADKTEILFKDIATGVVYSLVLHAIPIATTAVTFFFDKKWFKVMCIVTGITIIYMSLIFV